MNQELLKERLSYCTETGNFLWKDNYGSRAKAGAVAGNLNKLTRYIFITVNNEIYPAHRLAFLYVTGRFPQNDVDHINGVRHDNRWCNLRDVSRQDNLKNSRKSKSNTSGITGVWWDKKTHRWGAQIKHNYKTIHLGQYDDIEDARKARQDANTRYAFHKNHGL